MIAIFVLALCTATVAEARGTVPIVPHENVVLTAAAGGPLTAEQVRGAIIRAAARTRYPWMITADGPDKLIATTLVRGKHTAEVSISYTPSSFSVTYRDSRNLNYRIRHGAPEIHPNYNVWVQQLVDAIQAEAAKK